MRLYLISHKLLPDLYVGAESESEAVDIWRRWVWEQPLRAGFKTLDTPDFPSNICDLTSDREFVYQYVHPMSTLARIEED